MSKAVLVIDMPACCIDCPCHFAEDIVWCGVKDKELETDDIETYKPVWCPLKPAPEKRHTLDNFWEMCANIVRNACIDEILGEESQ